MAEQPWVDSGILRSGKCGDDEELLVFGYSCKLFRDDEKALLIDQGKHLIPWMGDESLKIDRSVVPPFMRIHFSSFDPLILPTSQQNHSKGGFVQIRSFRSVKI